MTVTHETQSARLQSALFRIVLIVPGGLILLYALVAAISLGRADGVEPPDNYSIVLLCLELALYPISVVAGLAIYSQRVGLSTLQLLRWWLPVSLVALVTLGLAGWYQTEVTLAAGPAVYCVVLVLIGGRARRYGHVVVYILTLVGLVFAPFLFSPSHDYSVLIEGALLAGLCAAAAHYWRYVRRSRELVNKEVRQEVRQGMARDLHDLVAHEVTGMVVLARAAGAAPQGDTSKEALRLIEAAGTRAMTHIRVLVSASEQEERSMPGAVLSAELEALLEAFCATTRAQVYVDLETIQGVEFPAPVHIAAYKITSEALTNVRRHAESAENVRITAQCSSGELVLAVSDNGQGGGLGAGSGTGTASMTERAAIVGGSITVGRDANDWWTVSAVLPLKDMAPLQ